AVMSYAHRFGISCVIWNGKTWE
ncbi:hypothetical protein V3C99_001423, partial [Haemonchus contortus]